MKQVTVLAPAKLNLALDVVGLLPNGYHDLDMVMQTITLYERLTLRRAEEVQLRLPGSWVPVNEKNTAVKAARAFSVTPALRAVWIWKLKSTFPCAPAWPAAVPTPPGFWWG